MILLRKLSDIDEIGGKAYHLFAMKMKNTPPLFVCPASYFEKRKTDPALEARLSDEIGKTFSGGKLYAVRSSAIDEDSDGDSFAGIHKSVLNVKKGEILSAVERVYASAFTEKALAYRKNRGLKTEGIRMAVVIQEMVDAEFAGIINTINPVTDNPDEIIISATRGLGDKLADGSESGSTYTIGRDRISVQGEDILPRKTVRKLIAFAGEIARKTDRFQDIEFACRRGKVYFLQARAITTYKDIDPHSSP